MASNHCLSGWLDCWMAESEHSDTQTTIICSLDDHQIWEAAASPSTPVTTTKLASLTHTQANQMDGRLTSSFAAPLPLPVCVSDCSAVDTRQSSRKVVDSHLQECVKFGCNLSAPLSICPSVTHLVLRAASVVGSTVSRSQFPFKVQLK